MSNKDDAFNKETMTTPNPTPPKEFDLEHECECFECSVQGLHSNAQKCAQQGYKKAQSQFQAEREKLAKSIKKEFLENMYLDAKGRTPNHHRIYQWECETWINHAIDAALKGGAE